MVKACDAWEDVSPQQMGAMFESLVRLPGQAFEPAHLEHAAIPRFGVQSLGIHLLENGCECRRQVEMSVANRTDLQC